MAEPDSDARSRVSEGETPEGADAPQGQATRTRVIGHLNYAAVILAGGQGQRMGGVDKGWQQHAGQALVVHALRRLQAQTWPPDHILISANRHLSEYAALGVPVWPDAIPGFAGPLVGMLTALEHCPQPWLLTVPCDAPQLPLRLAETLLQALRQTGADLAMAATCDADGRIWPEPVCCLMRVGVRQSLARFLAQGGRRVQAWAATEQGVQVVFDEPAEREAFFNANTLADLCPSNHPGNKTQLSR